MSSSTSSSSSAIWQSDPVLALPECWYWIRKLQARFFAGDYASAIEASSKAQRLLWTSPSFFEMAEYHFYGALSRAASCDSAAADERHAASRGAGRPPQTARGLGGELPGEFREPRRAGRRGDRTHRRPRARCRAPLRTGHPLGARKRLCPQRGARQRTRRALLRGAWLREDSPMRICGTPATAICVGEPMARCGNSTSSIRTCSEEEPVPAPTQHDRRAGRTAGSRDRDQGLAGRVGRDRAGEADRDAMRTAIEHAGAERGLLILLAGRRAADRGGSDDRRRPG